MDEWIAGQNVLLKVARDKQSKTDFHAVVEYDPSITEYPINSYVLFTPPVGRSDKLLPRHRGPYQVMDKLAPSTQSKTWLMESGSLRIFTTYGLSTMIQRGQCPW
jgi:hypothetical protein